MAFIVKKPILDLQQNITIPTLLSPAGSSQNYVFSTTDDIYFEAEVYLNSYADGNAIIEATSTTYEIVNEFSFQVIGNNGAGPTRLLPVGSFGIYNGERGESLSIHYTDVAIIDLNTWTKVAAKRINGVWSLFINDIACSVSRFDDYGVPNDQFGNIGLPVYIGRSEQADLNFDGQIRNVFLDKKNKLSLIIKKSGTGESLYNPIAFWHLDEISANRADATNGEYTLSEGGTSVGSAIGKIGNAANFNGTNTKFLTNSSISVGSTFSIACWVKLNSYSPSNEKAIWGCGTSGNHFISLYIQNSNNTFTFYNDGVSDIITSFVPALNTWYHTVVTITPNGAKLYIDGNLIGSVIYSPSFDSSWTNFSLSNFYIDGPAGYPIDAVIDEAGIWDIELSQEQVTNIYRNIPTVFKIKKPT